MDKNIIPLINTNNVPIKEAYVSVIFFSLSLEFNFFYIYISLFGEVVIYNY